MELYYHNNHKHRSDEILDGDIDEVLQAKTCRRCGRIQYDCHLITALVERWRSETHTFHFRVGEATITLQDVQVIWGLPIDGEPVSGTDLERTSVQWQEYCMQYIGFAPEEGALKGSRLQYARAVALLLLGGTMCPDSSGNLVSLLYLAKLEDIVAARNYSWGSAVLAFLYRELCNASEKGKAAIGGALQFVQIWAWSRIIPLCPGLGAPRVHMGQHQIDNNRVLPGAPYGAMWNCEHTFTRTVRTTVRVIRDILYEMQHDQTCGKRIPTWRCTNVADCDSTVAQLEHEVQIIAEAIKHQPQQTATPSDSAPTTSHRQRRSSSQMSIGSVERGDIGVDIAGPSTAYTPQDYYVPQPPQDYYVPQPSQDDWFQSTSYMQAMQAYSSHVDLDLGLGFNQPYAPEYNISPVPFPSFSAYRDNVESSSAASSSGLHINSGGDDNDGQNEPIQNMGEEIRRPRRQRHRRNCGTGGHF
ncbi:UNVERIFIED_CONTAM: Serine/threonine-protein phosphatase 7 long form [Sesamum angustifolium]|uniref:Serine/threonine-protein phosphatase 7 long form n=1 Tax=Sesamum angustifolium TaxID=2727405 RepID=A0AAW2PRR2_9LAMI